MPEPLGPEINRRIRLLLQSFAALDGPEERYPFVCECGCLKQVQLTLAEFDGAEGHYLDGHPLGRRRAPVAG